MSMMGQASMSSIYKLTTSSYSYCFIRDIVSNILGVIHAIYEKPQSRIYLATPKPPFAQTRNLLTTRNESISPLR
jgi:hypothetical protein